MKIQIKKRANSIQMLHHNKKRKTKKNMEIENISSVINYQIEQNRFLNLMKNRRRVEEKWIIKEIVRICKIELRMLKLMGIIWMKSTQEFWNLEMLTKSKISRRSKCINLSTKIIMLLVKSKKRKVSKSERKL